MNGRLSRRTLLYGAATFAVTKGQLSVVPTEARRFRDPATEFDLTRLTDPAKSNCWIPRPPLSAFSRNGGSLLYCSDRSGKPQAWRMDLRSGESRCLTSAEGMIPQTLTWMPNDRGVLFFDGRTLVVHSNKPRTVCTLDEGWEPQPAISISSDGTSAAFAERHDDRYRVCFASLGGGAPVTLYEAPDPLAILRFRPKRNTLLYGHSSGLALVNASGRGERRLRIAPGVVRDAIWSADGGTLHYLLSPESRAATQLRDFNPESGEDKLVGATTQFVAMAANSNASVFAGVSGSKGAPYILLLIRAARREMTLAEHKGSDPSRVAVAFSPDSQRLYYHTDREGRSAIYVIALERFVEKTDAT